jgi:hypothetical protein
MWPFGVLPAGALAPGTKGAVNAAKGCLYVRHKTGGVTGRGRNRSVDEGPAGCARAAAGAPGGCRRGRCTGRGRAGRSPGSSGCPKQSKHAARPRENLRAVQ